MKQKQCILPYECGETNFGARKKERDATARIDSEITAVLKQFATSFGRRNAFERLLTCLRARTDLLRATSGRGSTGAVFLINRLRNLAARHAHWIRPCEEWRPATANLRPAFRSLAAHLLGIYPTPGFLDSVWDLMAGPEGFRQHAWYIRLARGASLRELNLPLVLTRKMEHYVRQAPDHYSVCQAFRYGETLGLGGNEHLAREIAAGPLGRQIQHPDFWRTVLRFFVTYPDCELHQVNPIIDFIQDHRFPRCELLTEQEPVQRPAPWPDFSIEGRTIKSMLRLISAWHCDLAHNRQGPNFAWPKSDIEGYRFDDRKDGEEYPRVWTIEELLESNQLYAEGRALRHCVYTYANKCRQRQTAIWSLRLKIGAEEKRMATIELDPVRRRIIQIRAKCNLPAGRRSFDIIEQWATWAGLEFALQ